MGTPFCEFTLQICNGHHFETATLTWWDGLRGLIILLGYAGGSYTPGRFNLAGQANQGGS